MRTRSIIAILFALTLLQCGKSDAPTPLRPIPALPTEGFTIVLLPDAQCYSSQGAPYAPASCGAPPTGDISMLKSQMDWIVANRANYNIAAVIGLGDLVQTGARDSEWQAADSAYTVLDTAQIPYIAAIGNHDYDTAGSSIGNRRTVKFNQYFGLSRFSNKPWLGQSSYPAGMTENSYAVIETDSRKYLLLSLEFFPRNAALQWAAGVIDANPDCDVILVTHTYLGPDGSRSPSQYNGAPSLYGLTDGNDGESVWTNFVSPHSRIVTVVNGHIAPLPGTSIATGWRVDTDLGGNRVAQIASNFQYAAGGGNGYLRLLNFQPDRNKVVVQTYSPFLKTALTDPANNFSASYGPVN